MIHWRITIKKDCMFQFATNEKIYEDTDLITYKEAVELWKNNLSRFIELHNEGHDPEMCIWINCKYDTNYRTSICHLNYETIVKNGRVYELKEIYPPEDNHEQE